MYTIKYHSDDHLFFDDLRIANLCFRFIYLSCYDNIDKKSTETLLLGNVGGLTTTFYHSLFYNGFPEKCLKA